MELNIVTFKSNININMNSCGNIYFNEDIINFKVSDSIFEENKSKKNGGIMYDIIFYIILN